MQTWEYRTIQGWKQNGQLQWSSTLETFLNDQGRQGWELVSVVDREMHAVEWIFKRPLRGVTGDFAAREAPAVAGRYRSY